VCYPSPNDDKSFDALTNDIEHFQADSMRSTVLSFRDFNYHHLTWLGRMDMYGNPKTNAADVACYVLCQTSGLVTVISKTTFLHNKGNAESMLGIVLIDNPALVSKVSFKNAVDASAQCRIVDDDDEASNLGNGYCI